MASERENIQKKNISMDLYPRKNLFSFFFCLRLTPKLSIPIFLSLLMYNFFFAWEKTVEKWKYVNIFVNSSNVFFLYMCCNHCCCRIFMLFRYFFFHLLISFENWNNVNTFYILFTYNIGFSSISNHIETKNEKKIRIRQTRKHLKTICNTANTTATLPFSIKMPSAKIHINKCKNKT